jgi:NADH:ubiquinone oxidoreductase subunit F (NADH-binding)
LTTMLDTPPLDTSHRLMRAGAPRILANPPATSLADHFVRYGPLLLQSRSHVVAEVEAAGLRGRGGAGFPTGVKMRAVCEAGTGKARRATAPVVVANGTEGEPASGKDKVLLTVAPHLVLDGMVAAAYGIGARRAILCIERGNRPGVGAAHRALQERGGRDPVHIEIAETPPRYTTGEETALISWLNGGPARPTFGAPRPFQAGVEGAPTLVDNVETLANVALIARVGSEAYRMAGEPAEPGTLLVTAAGGVSRPGVYELEIGTPMAGVLDMAGAGRSRGVLVGGYFGTWLSTEEARRTKLSTESLRAVDASLGCGLLASMPAERCPLQDVSDVLHWLAASSAGQCGACVNGLPALAGAFDGAVGGDTASNSSARLDRWTPMLLGRGACKLPDGAVRFLHSARRVFASHLDDHRRYGPCPANPFPLFPTPRPGEWR